MYYLYINLLDVSNSTVQGARGYREQSLSKELRQRYTERLVKHEQYVFIENFHFCAMNYGFHEGNVPRL